MRGSSAPGNNPPPASPQTGGAPFPFSPSPDGEGVPEWRKVAWREVVAGGKYRLANPRDFDIPEAAMKDRYVRIDLENAVRYPFDTGNINHDAYGQDFAAIVVDQTKSDPARFSLIVVNEPPGEGTPPATHWLLKERDLSRSILSRWSGGLVLRTYKADVSYDSCFVNWNERRKEYACEERYRQP